MFLSSKDAGNWSKVIVKAYNARKGFYFEQILLFFNF